MIEVYEDFATGIPAGFATVATKNNYAMTVTHNPTIGSADLVMTNEQGAWMITSFPTASALDYISIEADLELVADVFGGRHLGLWMAQPGPYMYGYRFSHYTSDGWSAGRWDSWTSNPALQFYSKVGKASAFNIGNRKVLRLEKRGNLFCFYIDGALEGIGVDNIYPSVQVGIHLYGCTVRVHSVRCQYAVSAAIDSISKINAANLTWANKETRAQAWPGENHWASLDAPDLISAAPITQIPHFTVPPTRAELGFIDGIVTVKSVPAPNRHVYCFDESMNIVAETVSGSDGHYRFDSLLRNRQYLVLAQDNFSFKYAPASADRRTPEAYP